MAAALQIPQVFTRGSSYESAKAIQSPHHIPGLKLTNKVGKSRALPAYLPGVTPPPGMTADKCIMHYHYALSVCNCVCAMYICQEPIIYLVFLYFSFVIISVSVQKILIHNKIKID